MRTNATVIPGSDRRKSFSQPHKREAAYSDTDSDAFRDSPASHRQLGMKIPPAGVHGLRSCSKKTVVFGRHFHKSTHVSVQAVALGGNPLKRKTGMAGEEVDFGGGRLRGPRASTNNTVPRSVVAPCESQRGIWMPAGR